MFEFPLENDYEVFAKAIGLNLTFDAQHKWIVDQALTSELPKGYNPIINPEGKVYFQKGNTVSFQHPLINSYKKIYAQVTAEEARRKKETLSSENAGSSSFDAIERSVRSCQEDAFLFYKKECGDPAVVSKQLSHVLR